MQLAQEILEHENRPQREPLPDGEPLRTGVRLHTAAVDYVIAFIFGHELFHYFGNTCISETKPRVVDAGIWEALKKLQQTEKGLFDPTHTLDIDEMLADRCGLRAMEQVNQTIEDREKDPILLTASRRIATDTLAGSIILGFERWNLMSARKPSYINYPDYLYAQTRLLLFNSTLRLMDRKHPWAVKLSGKTAEAMVTLIQAAVTDYPDSSGDVPDQVLAELPRGVEEGWATGEWKPAFFHTTR